MNEPRPEDTLTNAERFKRRLSEALWEWVRYNWKFLFGVVGGFCTAYIALQLQVHGAREAAQEALRSSRETAHSVAELRQSIGQLVTQRELDDAKERIVELESRLDYATREAGTPPTAPRHRRK